MAWSLHTVSTCPHLHVGRIRWRFPVRIRIWSTYIVAFDTQPIIHQSMEHRGDELGRWFGHERRHGCKLEGERLELRVRRRERWTTSCINRWVIWKTQVLSGWRAGIVCCALDLYVSETIFFVFAGVILAFYDSTLIYPTLPHCITHYSPLIHYIPFYPSLPYSTPIFSTLPLSAPF